MIMIFLPSPFETAKAVESPLITSKKKSGGLLCSSHSYPGEGMYQIQ